MSRLGVSPAAEAKANGDDDQSAVGALHASAEYHRLAVQSNSVSASNAGH